MKEGFLVAKNPNLCFLDHRCPNSFVREYKEWISFGRKSVDIPSATLEWRRIPTLAPPPNKEKEYMKSLCPSVWLTDHFLLKMEELLRSSSPINATNVSSAKLNDHEPRTQLDECKSTEERRASPFIFSNRHNQCLF
uniref:Uncharacterized protein n=1 Tax=Nelumbo nucifera TaxID=4432 RepID=A0A822XN07_NELNU|nr:TPA_asm: hypothetical protein HUJ06_022895 [Nelumbo nucifera]